MKKVCAFAAAISITAASVFSGNGIGLTEVSADTEVEKNYAKALQYSMYFYDANMCGTDVDENNRYKWRADCHTYDSALPLDPENTNMSDSFIKENMAFLDPDGDGCVDVSGGFHDAGDHVKFGMPEA